MLKRTDADHTSSGRWLAAKFRQMVLQVPVADRWAIAAYIRALQTAGRGTVNDVPADRRGELDGQPAAATPQEK